MSLRTVALPAIRVLSGLMFLVFGLNGFLHFLPAPPPSDAAKPFIMGLLGAGYFFPLLKGTEVAMGILLLANRFVPLALAVLTPIVINIFAFHFFLDPKNLGLPIVIVGFHLLLAWNYRSAFRPMLQARNVLARESKPASAGSLASA